MTVTAPTLVSACLIGVPCRYDGRSKPVTLPPLGAVLPVCPEAMAGFGVPRPAIARDIDGRVRVVATGEDVSERLAGAVAMVLELAAKNGVSRAILKEYSPSCGSRWLRDRDGSARPGRGVLAEALIQQGIAVQSEITP